MNYIEYQFSIKPIEPWREILLAYLSELNIETFVETELGLSAYILKGDDDEVFIKEQINLLTEVNISYERKEIEQINWNQEWENNFSPININNQCYIRAEFHKPNHNVLHEIVIQPKMSFGTGHHETTHLMVDFLLNLNVENKLVLDMGCGTSILAILAKMKGASYVEAIDIDEWSVENSIENAKRNNVDIHVKHGDVTLLGEHLFDFILANINKNILLKDIPKYIKQLKGKDSELILSGLLDIDFDDILTLCTKNGLTFVEKKQRNDWIAIRFKK